MSKPGATSKASKKNQTTIPARVRRALGIAKGDTLLWVIDGDEVSLRKMSSKGRIRWTSTSDLSLIEWGTQEAQQEAVVESEQIQAGDTTPHARTGTRTDLISRDKF